jgi:hypothetical protein
VGGTLGIATNYPYSYQAKSLIKEIGIPVDRYSEYVDSKLFRSLGLRRGTFFDKEHFGEDRLVVGEGSIPWPEFFAQTPMSDQAKKTLRGSTPRRRSTSLDSRPTRSVRVSRR